MKAFQLHAALGAVAILFPSLCVAKHGHSHNLEHLAYKRHNHNHLHVEHTQDAVEKRDATCAFPTGAGLVPITPNMPNGGWAMSPDQQCLPGNFCPFACPSGQVMAQWNPAATSYIYPLSLVGHNEILQLVAYTDLCRMVDYSAVSAARSASRSPTSPTAWTGPTQLEPRICALESCRSARRSCPETRPC